MKTLKTLIAAAPLGNTQRNDRLFELVATLIAGGPVRPSGAAPWAHAMASYRFFNNDAVSLVALYGIAHAALRALVAPKARVYIAHDPSILDYSRHHAKADRVPVGNHRGLGYELFTALVLDAAGRPLGPVFQEVRTAKGCYASVPTPGAHPDRPARFVGNIEQMEKAIAAAKVELPDAERVHVADSEFDDIAMARGCGDGYADAPCEPFVLRAQHLTRRVVVGGTPCRLTDAADGVRLARLGSVTHDGTRYRQFVGEVAAVVDGVSYRGRHRGQAPQPGVALRLRVVVVELRARGVATIRWVLLTNLRDAVAAVVAAYVFRWKVERYFYLTKTGFKLEAWTQQTGARLARRLAVSSLAAMVIYQLLALGDDPVAGAAVREIARRGNWLGRKRDPLGPIVLMRGMLFFLGSVTMIEHLGVAKIRAIAEWVLPGITREIREHSTVANV